MRRGPIRPSIFLGANRVPEREAAMNIVDDIESLTAFKRQTPYFVKRLKKTGNPLVLTNKGKAEIVVHSAEAYQKLMNQLEYADSVAGIRRGLESTRKGLGRPIDEVLKEMRDELELDGEE